MFGCCSPAAERPKIGDGGCRGSHRRVRGLREKDARTRVGASFSRRNATPSPPSPPEDTHTWGLGAGICALTGTVSLAVYLWALIPAPSFTRTGPS